MSLRLIAGAGSEDHSAVALSGQPDGIRTHLSRTSWGDTDDGKASGRNSAIRKAGGGLGSVIVVPAGNGQDNGVDSSYDEFSGSRYAIGVGAAGAESQPPNVTWTDENSGDEADTAKRSDFPGTKAPIDHTDARNSTSAAAPQISGTAALLLQTNPTLGSRDAKEILLKNAGGFRR